MLPQELAGVPLLEPAAQQLLARLVDDEKRRKLM
jgi:hypothetical protein